MRETEHEFYVELLKWKLGDGWVRDHHDRPAEQRHCVLGWMEQWEAMRHGQLEGVQHRRESETRFSSLATGDCLALMAMAYDVYCLEHSMALPEPLVQRLRQRNQFQGARYELAVAAIFCRSGYSLDWLTDMSRPLPEFIATHQASGTELAVEAKSRHRPGVLGQPGGTVEQTDVEVGVTRLMRRALAKDTDGRALVVCIDLNLPTRTGRDAPAWVEHLHTEVLSHFERPGQPDDFAAAFFTNFAWHWDGADLAGPRMTFSILPDLSVAPMPKGEFVLLDEAIAQYGHLPGAEYQHDAA